LCHFTDLELFKFTSEDIERFFEEKSAQNTEHQPSVVNEPVYMDVVDEGPSIEQILAEEVADGGVRRAIQRCIGRDCLTPPAPVELTVSSAPRRFFGQTGFFADFGFGVVAPHAAGDRFQSWSPITYEKIEIPSVIVNRQGMLAEMSADSLFSKWVEDRLEPISGPKPTHFIAFFEQQLPQGDVETFMRQFAHIYKNLGFGQAIPFRRSDPFRPVPADLMAGTIREFYSLQMLSEFQQQPVVSFVFGHPLFEPTFTVKAHVIFIPPSVLTTATETEIGALAFDVYARIRVIDMPLQKSKLPAVTMKYQPPFFLRRVGDRLTLDLLFESGVGSITVSDDIGSILIGTRAQAKDGTPIDVRRQTVDQLAEHCQFQGEKYYEQITLAVFAEGVSLRLLESLEKMFPDGLQLFTVFPAPGVQARFHEEFTEDALVFESPEQMLEGEGFSPPAASCFVLSQTHTAYKVSIYRGGGKSELTEYAKRLSALSWLTARPGAEKRSLSFPPQLTAMVRQTNVSVLAISRFEFLPSTDVI
jgi:hypothetical protein